MTPHGSKDVDRLYTRITRIGGNFIQTIQEWEDSIISTPGVRYRMRHGVAIYQFIR